MLFITKRVSLEISPNTPDCSMFAHSRKKMTIKTLKIKKLGGYCVLTSLYVLTIAAAT